MKQKTPRIMLAGTHSGCGKTTVTCALLQAFINRGLQCAAFKCGPDYIDPMFHREIIGAKSGNLDLFFFDGNTARYLLAENSRDCKVSLVEGVMGFYDGLGTSTRASSYEVSRETGSPVILLVDAKGASLSALAVIQGFLSFCPDHNIRGVILNRCSAASYGILKDEIIRRFAGRVSPLGYFPERRELRFESRHLGLVTAAEVTGLKQKMHLLAAQAEESLNIDGILALAETAPELDFQPLAIPRLEESVRIAVARDKAFCFYYEDNLALLGKLGAELAPFSPLKDKELPENIHGLYLGGGYPELYARELSENGTMRASVRRALQKGLPCIAECGGFMYLTDAIGEHPMTGFINTRCYDTGGLRRFGYVRLEAQKDCVVCKAGECLPAHEFHHWDCAGPGTDFKAVKAGGKSWDCVYADAGLYAGFPHLHFYSDLNAALRFYRACLEEKRNNG